MRTQEKTSRTGRATTRKASKGTHRYVYGFGGGKAIGHRDMKDLLGGKGAGLAEMTNAGLPMPPGFTISTEACTLYYARGGRLPASVDREMLANLRALEEVAGAKLGSVENPLLVSVRSGAKFSMPGMMDTILNLGLNDESVEGLKDRTSNGRFAFDSYRRFIQMFGSVVLGISKDAYEDALTAAKGARGATVDSELDETGLREVVGGIQEIDQEAREAGLSPESVRATAYGARCGVPLVAQCAGDRVPPNLRHPGSHRHRREHPADGLWQ